MLNNNKLNMKSKPKILVSFSAGETSAYMAYFLKKNYSDKYEFIYVFANTGEENEETLIFAKKCDEHFNLNLVWVEPKINMNGSTKHTVVNFKTAERSGENGNFEKMIQRFGIPNMQNAICTRELKERPITSYARSIGWKHRDYHTAIGIRCDEIDRMSVRKEINRLIYPFIEFSEINKPMVNRFWNYMPFRLKLKGYQGNCKWCWKKSFRKLATIIKENVTKFDFPRKMESKYSEHLAGLSADRIKFPIRFFREFKTVEDIVKISLVPKFKPATDDSTIYHYQSKLDFEFECIGSCEPFNN